MSWMASTPAPPYYAVIFSSTRRHAGEDGYEETARRMLALAPQQPGFLGIESVREGDRGITVSYWRDEAAIAAWRAHAEHRVAQARGRRDWYEAYCVRVVRVERAYGRGQGGEGAAGA